MSVITTEHSLKMIRETMCLAEHALYHAARTGGVNPRPGDLERIKSIIADIDRQRPLGSDGKHGDLHTPTCGCDDQ